MMSFKHRPATTRWAGLLSACGVSAMALMAGMSQPARAQDASASSGALEQIVVTAEHKPEYEKDVPLAVTSLNSTTLDALTSSGDDIRFLAARVPSLNVESSFGRTYPRFYIRGLGNSDFTYNAQQPVSVVADDVVLENPILKAFPIFDTSDVEVLRGPQGTLFGRNTPAGVVKIDTVKPNDDYSGYADLSYGNFNTVDFSAAVGGAIVPNKLDFRLSVLEERRDGYVENINPQYRYPEHKELEGYSDTAARLQLLFKPTDNLDALLEVDGRMLDGTARVFRADIIQQGTNHLVGGFNVNEVNTNGDNYQYLGTWGTHLTINDDFGPVTLTSVSAYEHGSIRSRGDISGGNFVTGATLPSTNTTGTAFPDETSDSVPGLDQITQELRLQTNGDGPFFNQGGFFYFHEYLRVDSFDYDSAGDVDIALNQTQSTESFGVFDSATYKLTQDLTLGAGVRFSTDSKDYNVGCLLTCANPTKSTVHTNDSDTTFDVSADYALTANTNVYARIATGYLAPALDGRNVEYDFGTKTPLSIAKAETTTSYEIGTKSNLFDHRANLNLTAYYWDTENLQLAAVGGASAGTNLINAKTAIGEGLEAEFEFKPTEQWLLTTSASYNFTQIQDPNLEVAGCSGGCTMQNQYDSKTGYYKINGNPLPNAPRWIVDASARYSIPLNKNNEIYALTDWSYRSSEDFFLYKATEFTGQSLLLGGLRVGYIDHDRGFEVAAFVHNILDQVKVTGAIDFDNLTGFVNDPRTYGVEVRYKF